MIILALLLGAGSAQSSASKNADFALLYREFKAVCDTAIDRGDTKAPALAAGWQPTTRAANSDLAIEAAEYEHENWAHWHFEHNFFSKQIGGRTYYIHERIGHPDAQGHSLLLVNQPGLPEEADPCGSRAGCRYTSLFIGSDFGGDSYSFQDDAAPHKPTLEITWLTHELNPRFRGSLNRKDFDSSMGPARPPTLTIQARVWKEETR